MGNKPVGGESFDGCGTASGTNSRKINSIGSLFHFYANTSSS